MLGVDAEVIWGLGLVEIIVHLTLESLTNDQ